MRKDLDKHLKDDCPMRDLECTHCGKKGAYAYIQVHSETCDQKILPCLNKCTKTMPRRDIEKHVNSECEYTVVTCKFKNIGCKAEMKRGDMATHEQNDRIHLSKALDAVAEMQDYVSELQCTVVEMHVARYQLEEKVVNLESDLNATLELNSTLKYGQSVTFKVPGFQQKKANNERFASPSFYTSPGGYHMGIHVDANGYGDGEGTHVSVHATRLDGKYDTELSWPFFGRVTFTLLNQLEDDNHYHYTCLTVFDTAKSVKRGGYTQFIPHSELAHDPVKKTQYLKDDTLYFRVVAVVSDHKPWLECTAK